MKKAILLCLFLTACGGRPIYEETSPGYPLPDPSGFNYCKKRDMLARCMDWSVNSASCVNPKGIYEKEPIVACSTIKPEDRTVKSNDEWRAELEKQVKQSK